MGGNMKPALITHLNHSRVLNSLDFDTGLDTFSEPQADKKVNNSIAALKCCLLTLSRKSKFIETMCPLLKQASQGFLWGAITS